MEGMKDGAKGIDFGADTDDSADETDETTDQPAARERPQQATERDESRGGSSGGPDVSLDEIPLVQRRTRVKEGRDDVIQIPALTETHDDDREALRQLADRFNTAVPKLDRREAIYLAGLANLDDAEAQLREWGHDLGE